MLDDEPQVLAAIEDTLEGEYHVVVQTSPQAALRVVENEPDLSVILSDQRMPGMNGDEFLAKASAVSDASRLMITGYADLEAVISAVNNGHIFGYISKPWDPAGLKLSIFKASDHHRLLRELAEEKRLFQNLMDNIPDAIFFKDLMHRFLRLNPPHARLLGVERPEDAVGRTSLDFFSPELAREHGEEDDEIARSGLPLADRVRRFVLPGGGVRWSSTTKAPIKDDKGQVSGIVGISRDITEREQAEEKIRRLNRVYAVLSGINGLIVRVTDREELYREACRIAVEAGHMRMAWLGTYDRQAKAVKPVAWHGHEDGFLRLAALHMDASVSEGRGLVRRTVRDKRPVIINDVEHDAKFRLREEALARGYRSGATLPLIIGGEVIGVLGLFSGQPEFFDDEEMRLLTELAGDISFALDHIEKSERVNYLAYYDSLTGLANRALFFDRVTESLHSTSHAPSRVALIVADIER
ncbi:MAG TPA: GAF domain-containing protein, partial [Candidatus Krumholzibacteria bacterium]